MRGEIIAIGDELTSGRILNSTSNFAARHLFTAGHDIIAMHTIGDEMNLIGDTLRKSLQRADFVVVTGGLGATTDDLTNEAVATAFDLPVTFHPEIFAKVNSCDKRSSISADLFISGEPRIKEDGKRNNNLEKLAWLPEGAEVLKPEGNMAGYVLIHDGKPIFFLPGVPHEMKELLADVVIPRLAGTSSQAVKHKLYKLAGVGETVVNEKLRTIENKDGRVRIGYYPVFPEVHVSLTVRDENQDFAEQLFTEYDSLISTVLKEHIFACDGDTIEAVVGRLLQQRKKTLATAESCTGGLVSHAITRVSGSSAYFAGGVVAYSNDLKERLLAVKQETLVQFGAVSEQVAREMAVGARNQTGADLGISLTGIAGPTGGTKDKPVGTVYFGLATAEDAKVFLYHFKGDRWKIQHQSSHVALDLVRRALL